MSSVKQYEDPIIQFYQKHIRRGHFAHGVFSAPCPFCQEKGHDSAGKIIVNLNPGSFFHGYFRCTSHCIDAGFPYWFAHLSRLDLIGVPGYRPDNEQSNSFIDYPIANSNSHMRSFHDRISEELFKRFEGMGIGKEVLHRLQIGFNGRYVTYPYVQANGNCYSLRCVFPDRDEDFFWDGDDRFTKEPFHLFNVMDIERCRYGSLFLCEGEDSVLLLKSLGYPAVAVPDNSCFETLDPQLFEDIQTLFVVTKNIPDSRSSAREFAARTGYKVRLLNWPQGTETDITLTDFAGQVGKNIRKAVARMIHKSTAFSPFSSPEYEYVTFLKRLEGRESKSYRNLYSGFPLLDNALEGIHGLNVIGGAPKVGKSAFAIQVASQMAERGVPVLYYDFENGRQRVYQRIVSRLSRLKLSRLTGNELSGGEADRFAIACKSLEEMLSNFKVVNDRKLTPELMRRHIDFIRHETHSEYTVVVIDSLHKLPFKDFNERRTGIDAWLRQLESIRDELQVSFIVISELIRGAEQGYSEKPHMGLFKGSGDIEYSADNAMVLFSGNSNISAKERDADLWVVASREHTPGPVASYRLDYPFWGFVESEYKVEDHKA